MYIARNIEVSYAFVKNTFGFVYRKRYATPCLAIIGTAKGREHINRLTGRLLVKAQKHLFQRVFLTYPLSGAESPQIEMGKPASRILDVFKKDFLSFFFLSLALSFFFSALLLGPWRGRARGHNKHGNPFKITSFSTWHCRTLCHAARRRKAKRRD